MKAHFFSLGVKYQLGETEEVATFLGVLCGFISKEKLRF